MRHEKVSGAIDRPGGDPLLLLGWSAGKTNLSVHIYEADHDLNYMQYVMTGTLPQPIADLLDACAQPAGGRNRTIEV